MFPVRAIHQIEMTSRCNLKCAYCPSYRLPRPKLDMSEDHFERALSWARRFHELTGYTELNLAGIGESTLHPQFARWVLRAREVMGDRVSLVLATNGLLMDNDMAEAIRPAKPIVFVSLHRPEKAQRAVIALRRAGILAGVSCDGATASVDWAGQVDWPVTTPVRGSDCDWIIAGKVVVLADGRISRCCFDASGAGVIGTLADDLLQLNTSPYKLCETCHLRQPDAVTQRLAA